jgi:hypothetical protein
MTFYSHSDPLAVARPGEGGQSDAGGLGVLSLEKHLDKILYGQIERDFDFLGDHRLEQWPNSEHRGDKSALRVALELGGGRRMGILVAQRAGADVLCTGRAQLHPFGRGLVAGVARLELGELDLGDCAARAQAPPLRLASPGNATYQSPMIRRAGLDKDP